MRSWVREVILAKIALFSAGFIDLCSQQVEYHHGECLLIEDGRILQFLAQDQVPEAFERWEYPDLYCLPGLVDTAFMPAWMIGDAGSAPKRYGEAVWNARIACRTWLQSGVLSAASMGAAERLDFDLAQSIAAGRLHGPHVLPALTPLVPAGAGSFQSLYGVREVCGVEQARQAARQVIKDGAERIVVYADVPIHFHPDPEETSRERLRFSQAELLEIVTQARQAGCFVHAQAISNLAIENCIQAGVRSIGGAYQLQSVHIRQMATNGIALAPNLALGATVEQLGPAASFPEEVVRMVRDQRLPRHRILEAKQAGVEIICGTNGAFLQGDVVRECQELNRAGMSEKDVLRAATVDAARAVKPYIRRGAFDPGFRADLILLGSDPAQDLAALQDVREIILGGNIWSEAREEKEAMSIEKNGN